MRKLFLASFKFTAGENEYEEKRLVVMDFTNDPSPYTQGERATDEDAKLLASFIEMNNRVTAIKNNNN